MHKSQSAFPELGSKPRSKALSICEGSKLGAGEFPGAIVAVTQPFSQHVKQKSLSIRTLRDFLVGRLTLHRICQAASRQNERDVDYNKQLDPDVLSSPVI